MGTENSEQSALDAGLTLTASVLDIKRENMISSNPPNMAMNISNNLSHSLPITPVSNGLIKKTPSNMDSVSVSTNHTG